MKKFLLIGMLISSLSFALGSSMKTDTNFNTMSGLGVGKEVDDKKNTMKEKMEKASDKKDEIQEKLSPGDRVEFDKNNAEIARLKAEKTPDLKKINVLSKKNELLLKQAKKSMMN